MNIRELLAQKMEIEIELQKLTEPYQLRLVEIQNRITEQATALLEANKDKDTGTWNLVQEGVKVKAVIGKNVKWDQAKLESIWNLIAGSGDNPKEYIAQEFKVSENAYKAWPSGIKNAFIPARTVTPTAPKFTFSLETEEDICPF